MNDEPIDEIIAITRDAGWPMVLQQSLVFSALDDSEFRIACAYLIRDGHNEQAFEDLISQYNPEQVASVISWVRSEGITPNG